MTYVISLAVIVEEVVEGVELEGASLVVDLHEGEVAFPPEEEVQLQGVVPCAAVEAASCRGASYLQGEGERKDIV